MSEIQVDDLTIPNLLPVLPLKDTVVFPESMTPLAIGQERSIMLSTTWSRGDRHAGARHGQGPGGRVAGLRTTCTRSGRRRSCTS